MGIIFDLDQTLIDSSIAENYRKSRNWKSVYSTIPEFSVYEGIMEAIDYIKEKQIPICIVTSSPSVYCTKVLNHWGIPYSSMVCYHDTTKRKPYPDPILLAIKKLNIQPDSIISFGDRDIDIIASKEAGVKSAACLWGSVENDSLIDTKPDYILNHPNEIVTTITKEFNI